LQDNPYTFTTRRFDMPFQKFPFGPTTPLLDGGQPKVSARALVGAIDQLGPLKVLPGTWAGTGFNQIWRPNRVAGNPRQDRFLELNLTSEELVFTVIGTQTPVPTPGDIANRALLQADISLFGVTYLQQISDVNAKVGIHVEPGIWVTVPATTDPLDPATVVRMASIPHGTTFVAQGTASDATGGPTFPGTPTITNNILPFPIAGGAPITFPEQNLSVQTPFRTDPANLKGITQAMVDNPNTVLQAGLVGKTITAMTVLTISTSTKVQPVPATGGGQSNIAFLAGAGSGPNAINAEVDAVFWLQTYTDPYGKLADQLQYAQRVLLNFNTLSWPHVSVATLTKQ
jgi:hypothetical protein